MDNKIITVVLADANEEFRSMLKEGIELTGEFVVVGAAGDGVSALRLIEAYRPKVFVCGHSHILKVVHDKHYDMMVLNPGACGLQGFHLVRTALRFRIEDGKLKDMEVGEWPKTLSQP